MTQQKVASTRAREEDMVDSKGGASRGVGALTSWLRTLSAALSER